MLIVIVRKGIIIEIQAIPGTLGYDQFLQCFGIAIIPGATCDYKCFHKNYSFEIRGSAYVFLMKGNSTEFLKELTAFNKTIMP